MPFNVSFGEDAPISVSFSAHDSFKATMSEIVEVPTPIPPTLQDKTVAPDINAKTVHADDGYDGLENVTVEAMPSATWGDGSNVTLDPVLAVDYETGEITATNNGSVSVNPVSVAGYAEPSHAFPINVRGNIATQLYTIDAQTYTPNKTAPQIIPAGRFLTGDQTIAVIPAQYNDMSKDMAWLGNNVELLNNNIYTKEDNLKNTLFNGWTPSTTAKALVASVNVSPTVAIDLANYEYYIVWECGCDPVYTGTPTLKAHTLLAKFYLIQEICKRPSSWVNIQANAFNGNACVSMYTGNFLRYYGTTQGTVTYSWNVNYGFYFAATAATFANSTANETTMTIKTPTFNARCSTTYMSTANAALVDKEESEWYIKGKLYRVTPNGIMRNIYAKHVGIINA